MVPPGTGASGPGIRVWMGQAQRGMQEIPAAESVRIQPGDPCREQPYLADSGDLEIRAKVKCYGSRMAFLPKKRLRDGFLEKMTPRGPAVRPSRGLRGGCQEESASGPALREPRSDGARQVQRSFLLTLGNMQRGSWAGNQECGWVASPGPANPGPFKGVTSPPCLCLPRSLVSLG